MKKSSALEVIRGLDAPQGKRLSSYIDNLATDKDPKHFDDKMKDLLKEISSDHGKLVEEVTQYCDAMNWNQSKYKSIMIDTQVKRFTNEDVPNHARLKTFQQSKTSLLAEVKDWNLETLQYDRNESIVESLPRLDTHAGWSYIITGKRKKGEYVENLLSEYLVEESKARECGSFNKPILIGVRTQSGSPFDNETGEFKCKDIEEVEDLKKSRLVSMEDIFYVLAENKWAKPFQFKLGLTKWYAGGKSDGAINTHVQMNRAMRRFWMSLDYSKYDQSIPAWLIREAFDIVRAAFNTRTHDEELFKIVREDFINKVFVWTIDLIESGKGVPSGSAFTQIVDSIVNRLMIDTYFNSKGISSNNYVMMIMGDDNLIFSYEMVDLDDVESYLWVVFGIEMNAQKADHGTRDDDPIFLSRIWRPEGVYRHPKALIAKLLYPERFREYKKKNFSPTMVVSSYIDGYPLGMMQFVDMSKFRMAQLEEARLMADGNNNNNYMSGLAAYKQNYSEVLI